MLRGVDWQLVTEVSGLNFGPNFKAQTVQEDGTDGLSRNVGKQLRMYAA
jgi:hypothetical protein